MKTSSGSARRRARLVVPAWAVVCVLVATGCGSRLTKTELLSVTRQEGTGSPAAGGTGGVMAGSPSAAQPGAASAFGTPDGGSAIGATGGSTGAATTGAATGAVTGLPVGAGGSPSGSAAGPSPSAGSSTAASAAGTAAGTPGARPGAAPSTPGRTPAAPGVPSPTQPGGGPSSGASDGSPVKLGSIGTFSGVLGAAMYPGLQAAQAWTGYINAKGGLAGHPVQLVVADDRGDPNQAVALVHRLVEEDKVLAIYGSMQPSTVQSILPYVNEKQMPIIGTCSCMNAVATSPMVFVAGGSDKSGVTWGHIAGIFSGTQKRKVALFYCREAVTCSEYRNGIKQYEGHDGMHIVYETQMSLAQPDYTSEVLAARNAGAEIIVSVSENPTLIRIAKSAHRQGWDVQLSTQHGGDDSRFASDGGADVEGTVYSSPVAHWATSPLMADYRDSMKRYVPDGALGSLGAPMWVAGKMLERAARSFPAHPTTVDVLNGLWSVKGETLGGLIAPTTYLKGAAGNDAANECVVPLKIVNGKPTPTNGGPEAFSCAPGWKPA
jgi:branched-chain amino acid transport system substrate-binding protein